ncbi:MarR family transcriptional regulator [Sulfitobacter sp. F26204]|uniref:MarR family winged helix-turn-helix transcriptional regulator n=1 Tax=Sulfitobacter sp. F26204 TaxID=2996014 RepID=UPI00225E5E0C|nr:MarR family transcriptional regulator [Sulfitobacter sp. F26204]MCX7560638.1 MarR family transcriptional regulator [Sulfitobacter sp. F26204]
MNRSSRQAPAFLLNDSLGYLIRSTHHQFQSLLAARIEPHGITLGMWYFLRVLWEEEGLTQRELSNRVGTMEPTTLEAIRSMEGKGLVRRERDLTDGRKRLVFLTEKGAALEKVLLPIARDLVEDAVTDLTTREQADLEQLLTRVRSKLVLTRQETTQTAGRALRNDMSTPKQG